MVSEAMLDVALTIIDTRWAVALSKLDVVF